MNGQNNTPDRPHKVDLQKHNTAGGKPGVDLQKHKAPGKTRSVDLQKHNAPGAKTDPAASPFLYNPMNSAITPSAKPVSPPPFRNNTANSTASPNAKAPVPSSPFQNSGTKGTVSPSAKPVTPPFRDNQAGETTPSGAKTAAPASPFQNSTANRTASPGAPVPPVRKSRNTAGTAETGAQNAPRRKNKTVPIIISSAAALALIVGIGIFLSRGGGSQKLDTDVLPEEDIVTTTTAAETETVTTTTTAAKTTRHTVTTKAEETTTVRSTTTASAADETYEEEAVTETTTSEAKKTTKKTTKRSEEKSATFKTEPPVTSGKQTVVASVSKPPETTAPPVTTKATTTTAAATTTTTTTAALPNPNVGLITQDRSIDLQKKISIKNRLLYVDHSLFGKTEKEIRSMFGISRDYKLQSFPWWAKDLESFYIAVKEDNGKDGPYTGSIGFYFQYGELVMLQYEYESSYDINLVHEAVRQYGTIYEKYNEHDYLWRFTHDYIGYCYYNIWNNYYDDTDHISQIYCGWNIQGSVSYFGT